MIIVPQLMLPPWFCLFQKFWSFIFLLTESLNLNIILSSNFLMEIYTYLVIYTSFYKHLLLTLFLIISSIVWANSTIRMTEGRGSYYIIANMLDYSFIVSEFGDSNSANTFTLGLISLGKVWNHSLTSYRLIVSL